MVRSWREFTVDGVDLPDPILAIYANPDLGGAALMNAETGVAFVRSNDVLASRSAIVPAGQGDALRENLRNAVSVSLRDINPHKSAAATGRSGA